MGNTQPWHNWYDKRRWRRKSAAQLRDHPLCKMHLEHGAVVVATVADHVVPHKGDYKLFWFGKLQSLCGACHSSTKKQLEGKGYVDDIGTDGWPLDGNHPVYKVRGAG